MLNFCEMDNRLTPQQRRWGVGGWVGCFEGGEGDFICGHNFLVSSVLYPLSQISVLQMASSALS